MIDVHGVCAVCDTPLIHKFPSDYPDRFKFCCLCLSVLKFFLGVDGKKATKNFYNHSQECPSCGERIKMKEKILKLITFVKRNDS